MDKNKYDMMLEEVWGYMVQPHDSFDIKTVTGLRTMWERICGASDIIRDAVERSSLTLINGNRHVFTGKIYEKVSYEDLRNMVYDLLKRMGMPRSDFSRKETIVRDVADVIVKYPSEVSNSIVVFRNGVLDTDTMEFHSHDRKWIQVSSLNYDYNPDAKTYLWYTFLNEVLPDKTKQLILQCFLGAAFVDRHKARIESMLILKGSGSNGKSVVNDTVLGVFGKDNISMFGIKELISSGERKQNVAYMNGKRLNYCTEMQLEEFGKGSDTLKVLISGEALPARHPYGFNFTARNIPLLMANTNQLPYLKDISHGMARRLCVLSFDVEIPKERQNRTLSKDLEAEYPAIFNWIMEGRKQFVNFGYKLPVTHDLEDALEEYQEEFSTPLKFMAENGFKRRMSPDAEMEPRWMSLNQLYDKYSKWCTANKIIDVQTRISFSRMLEKAGWRKRRSQYGIEFGLFGKVGLGDLQMKAGDVATKLRKAKIKDRIMRVDGIDYAQGYTGLSKACGVGKEMIERLAVAGKLRDMTFYADSRTFYDIDKTLELLRKEGKFLDTREKHLKTVLSKDMKYERGKFNEAMRYHELPFRKYKEKGPRLDGTICVDDTMSIEEAKEKARLGDFGTEVPEINADWLVGENEDNTQNNEL